MRFLYLDRIKYSKHGLLMIFIICILLSEYRFTEYYKEYIRFFAGIVLKKTKDKKVKIEIISAMRLVTVFSNLNTF